MLKRLRLQRFKNFQDSELTLGPLTLLVGANAAGKSNLRDAFRFLHGIARGYTLAEIFGETTGPGGELVWAGIRGGTGEAAYLKASTFQMEIEHEHYSDDVDLLYRFVYSIEVSVGSNGSPPKARKESLYLQNGTMVFDSNPKNDPVEPLDHQHLAVRFPRGGDHRAHGQVLQLLANQPALSQIAARHDVRAARVAEQIAKAIESFAAMRFLDLSPNAMRSASVPGHVVLSDRGENLSSVLQSICASEEHKATLVRWLKLLTPMDVADFEFPADPAGRVLLRLLEKDGTAISAYSASDGTLRFLGILAALLSPRPPSFLFLEEIENGLHPSRLRLLVDLFESRTRDANIQIVASTHSPQVLALLHAETLKNTSIVFRLEGERQGQIRRLWDLPDAPRVLQSHDRAELLASGWFEDILEAASVESEPLRRGPGQAP